MFFHPSVLKDASVVGPSVAAVVIIAREENCVRFLLRLVMNG